MRALVGLALAVALLLAGLWWLKADSSAEPPKITPAASEGPTTSDSPPPSTAAAEPARVVKEAGPSSTRDRVSGDLATAPPAIEDAQEEGALLRGRFEVLDQHGVLHTTASGSFVPVLWNGNHWDNGKAVSVTEGHFQLRLAEGQELGISSIRLGDRQTWTSPEDRYSASGQEDVVIQARWPGLTILHVFGSDSGVGLDNVSVVHHGDNLAHPGIAGPKNLIVEGASSPIEIAAPDKMTFPVGSYWVGAPGYTWQRLTLDLSRGSERQVHLDRGGEVLVHIARGKVGEDLLRRASLRLHVLPSASDDPEQPNALPSREAWGDQVFQAEVDESTPMLISGAAPGDYVALVEIGDYWDEPLVLGQTALGLEAGRVSDAWIRLEAPQLARTPVPLAGTLLLPEAWDLSSLALHFEPLDLPGGGSERRHSLFLSDMYPVAQHSGLYRWRLPPVQPSRYLVRILSPQHQSIVDTGPNGNEAARIEIGAPADVELQLREDETGQVVCTEKVLWCCNDPEGSTGSQLNPATWSEHSQTYSFRAPAGAIRISFPDLDWRLDDPWLEVLPGPNQFVLSVAQQCGITLFLRDKGQPIPWDYLLAWETVIRAEDGNRVQQEFGPEDPGFRFVVPEPGRYVVEIQDIPGFESAAPFEIDVPMGTFVEKVIELTARR